MLAEGKGVHREVESEGSRRQSPELTNRNRIRGMARRTSLRLEVKSKDRRGRYWIPVVLPKPCSVDAAATWDESY